MKLSNETINLLKHLTTINPGIIIDAGNRVFSKHPSGAIRMTAVLPETFDLPFAVCNLNQFLNTISLIDDPELEFSENYVDIVSSSQNQKMRYYFSDPQFVKDQDNKPLSKKIDYDVVVNITKDDISRLNKAASVIGVDDICIFNRGENIYISALDKRHQDTSNTFEILIGSDSSLTDKSIKIFFRKSNLKLTNNDFNVSISKLNISTWVATDSEFSELTFYVSVERDSVFE